jgi:pimeloyl-ACP methyl ester carboxylesterase
LLDRLRAFPDAEQKADGTKRPIDPVRMFIGNREYPKYDMINRYLIYKAALLAEAERLAPAQTLCEREDLFFVTSAEARLNEWPQFTTTIDGANVHFAHIRSPEPGAMPLLMTHGWPGSIVEFAGVAGPLSDPCSLGGDAGDAFHLVLPSIPGFGLSGPMSERGWEVRRVAAVFAELMARLGYARYGAHGGDWGWAISRQLGRIRLDHVIGVHLTLISAYPTTEPGAEELSRLSPVSGNARWRPGIALDGGSATAKATRLSNPPSRRHWRTPWPIRRWDSSRGWWRSSRSGPIRTSGLKMPSTATC